MNTPMLTPTEPKCEATLPAASFLQLMWLASPALPVGGFSYSEGLETAVASGCVSTTDEVAEWLVHQLHLTLVRADLPVLAQALRAWRRGDTDRVRTLNDWLLQTRETAELRLQTEQMGRSLREWLRNLPQIDAATRDFYNSLSPTYPVLFALAAAGSGAGERDCLLSYAFSWAENMAQAAMKSVPLGQRAGQHIVLRLTQEIPRAVEQALQLHDEDRQAFSPMLAILCSRHETQYSRLFRS